MARTLTTKGGAPGTAGAGGSLLVLLFPSDAVPHGVYGIAPVVEERDRRRAVRETGPLL